MKILLDDCVPCHGQQEFLKFLRRGQGVETASEYAFYATSVARQQSTAAQI